MTRYVALFSLFFVLLAGCAQKVADIDRTQPNKIAKADLTGVWYYLETVTDVPPTSAANFEGETSPLEKIVWVFEEGYLLAYRAYPLVPGADEVDGGYDYSDPDYAEAPIAAFPILSHFDVIRQYSSSTGEQTNVIVEDGSDRPWYEREYARVDWSRNAVTNYLFINDWMPTIEATYHIDTERGADRSVYYERTGERLTYFDVPRRMLVEPDLWGCILSLPWYHLSSEDCAPAEIEVVASFARTEPRRDYEPLIYGDQDMSRFGYFRNERYRYDSRRGLLESGRQELMQRHNIWAEAYERDAGGDYVTDDAGNLVPIPMADRAVRTVAYHASATFPDDQLLWEAAEDTLSEWNDVGRESAALAKGVEVSEIGDVFVLCHNPVTSDDHEACGGTGFSYRPGDLRYSTLHWVPSYQLMGPLGYGPSAADPETGEIVSGRAYVYGDGINRYAEYGLDVIRFMNEDIEPDDLIHADHVRSEVRRRADGTTNLERVDPALRDIPIRNHTERDRRPQLDERAERRDELRAFDRAGVMNRLETARETGVSRIAANEEYERALSSIMGRSTAELTPEEQDRLDPARWLSPTHMTAFRRRRMAAMRHGLDFEDLIDPSVVGLARAYEGRTDYEQIWRELRADIFRAVALHEVGHTVGLRHNFQATFDSLNYQREYWDFRQENMFEPQNMADLYTLNAVTENQHNGRMLEYAYSSIMDYGLDFNTDLKGLGLYDRAAMIYGYTAGTVAGEASDGCEQVSPNDSSTCLERRPGFIEVFAKPVGELGRAGEILTSTDELGQPYDDMTTPNVPYLERWHYSTFMMGFPEFEDAFDRDMMRIDDFHAARDAGGDTAPVRVPYLFCSDEWTEALLSCQVYDGGADPFEQTMNVIDDYHAYYYFVNFKRDRMGWDIWDALWRYFAYTFIPLSNTFQNWYLAPEGADSTMDEYYWWAVHAGFNLIGETLATPPYGTFCTGKDGSLVHLSDEPGLDPSLTSDYYLSTYCNADEPFYEVLQGDGRRRFSAYDVDQGYDFADHTLEAGHYWATLAAFWAMIDPEAFVVGTDGDLGTFSISYYDFFEDEVHALVNAAVAEDYPAFAPVLEPTGETEGNITGSLHYPVASPVWNGSGYMNPATGESTSNPLGAGGARQALCDTCERSSDCLGYTGFTDGIYCQPVGDDGTFYCLQDCTNDEGLCADGFECDSIGNCVPEDDVCVTSACGEDNPNGSCDTNEVCIEGTCTALWPIVEANTTFSLMDDMIYYGMLYTTASYSTRYNDQLNIFKLGTGEAIEAGPGFELTTFVDPISGDEYGAIQEQCEVPEGAVLAGATGLCEPCEVDNECAGYTGEFGDTWCQPLEAEEETFYCLVDCTEDENACPDGTTCSEDSNCIPDGGECTDLAGECGEDNPLGSCDEGLTCQEGACVEPMSFSARCTYGLSDETGAVAMVLKGSRLAERYDETLAAWYAYNGDDEAHDLQLRREYSRARFELEDHITKINVIRAVFRIFGQVY